MRLTLELLGRTLSLSLAKDTVENDEPRDYGTTASQVETTSYDWWQDDKAVACFGLSPVMDRKRGR